MFSSVFSSLGWLGHDTKPIRMSMPCALCPIPQTGHQPFCLSVCLFLLCCWPCKCRNQRSFIYSAVVFCDLFVPLSSSALLFFTPLSSRERRGRVKRPYRRSKRVSELCDYCVHASVLCFKKHSVPSFHLYFQKSDFNSCFFSTFLKSVSLHFWGLIFSVVKMSKKQISNMMGF